MVQYKFYLNSNTGTPLAWVNLWQPALPVPREGEHVVVKDVLYRVVKVIHYYNYYDNATIEIIVGREAQV